MARTRSSARAEAGARVGVRTAGFVGRAFSAFGFGAAGSSTAATTSTVDLPSSPFRLVVEWRMTALGPSSLRIAASAAAIDGASYFFMRIRLRLVHGHESGRDHVHLRNDLAERQAHQVGERALGEPLQRQAQARRAD